MALGSLILGVPNPGSFVRSFSSLGLVLLGCSLLGCLVRVCLVRAFKSLSQRQITEDSASSATYGGQIRSHSWLAHGIGSAYREAGLEAFIASSALIGHSHRARFDFRPREERGHDATLGATMKDRPTHSPVPRRGFLKMAGGALALSATGGCAATSTAGSTPGTAPATTPGPEPAPGLTWSRGDFADRFDPWIEIERAAFANNVGEASRLAGERPILAVVKNNAYGLGDEAVGPLLANMPEVGGIACVRVEEALTMRAVGVTKPIVVMAEASEDEIEALVRHSVLPSVWLDDAPQRLARVANRLGRPVPVQLFVDTGMNREGMPYQRVRPWMEELARSESVEINGTYTMFSHDLEFDRVQLDRFEELLSWARARSLPLGTLHASPTVELFYFPEAHYDMVRPGNALFGNYPRGEDARELAHLLPPLRLQARVVRVERLEPGESAGFYRTFMPDQARWVALIPIGRTDGYPSAANNTCEVLIGGRLYPVVGGVNSAHTIIDIGSEKTVEVGDIVTMIGPDHPAIHPHEVARRTETSNLALLQAMNPRLPRVVV